MLGFGSQTLSFGFMATPPPVHSSSVIIGPPDELTKLVWYQFLEKRSVGRGIGVGLLAVSATSFSLLFRPWTWFSSRANTVKSSQIPAVYKVLPVVIGIASLVAGLRLRTKKYFKDPEAMREYVQLYHNECFAEAFKQLGGWDDLSRGTCKARGWRANFLRNVRGPGLAEGGHTRTSASPPSFDLLALRLTLFPFLSSGHQDNDASQGGARANGLRSRRREEGDEV